jgi:ABC-type antimicrobial peptide transport system permease subunit
MYEPIKFFINSQIIALGLIVLISSMIGNHAIGIFAERLFESPQNSRVFAEFYSETPKFEPKNVIRDYSYEYIESLDWNINNSNTLAIKDSTFPSVLVTDLSFYNQEYQYQQRKDDDSIPVLVSTQVLANFDGLNIDEIKDPVKRYNTLKSLRAKYIGNSFDLYARNAFENQTEFQKTPLKIFIQNTIDLESYSIAFPMQNKADLLPVVEQFDGKLNSKTTIYELQSRSDLEQFDPEIGGEYLATSLNNYESNLEYNQTIVNTLGYLFLFIAFIFIINMVLRLYSDSIKSSSILYSIGVSEWKIYLVNTLYSWFQVVFGMVLSIVYAYILLLVLSKNIGNNVLNIMLNYATNFDLTLPNFIFVSIPPVSLLYLFLGMSFVVLALNCVVFLQNKIRNPIENLKY